MNINKLIKLIQLIKHLWQNERDMVVRLLTCIFAGIASGMPLYVLFQYMPAWFRDEGIDLKTIGLIAFIQLPYVWKFVWAPAMDRFVLPFLGRRKGWLFIIQIIIAVLLVSLSFFDISSSLSSIVVVAVLIAFFSASQDIVIDAYRSEILPDKELGLGAAFHVNAYRLSVLIPVTLGLTLADHIPWGYVHWVLAGFMILAAFITIFIPEPKQVYKIPVSLKEATVGAFSEFFKRKGWKPALVILAFLFFYKLGDNFAVALSTPFYLDLGFTKTQIGTVSKAAGLWASVAGSILGGFWMKSLGIYRALWIFGIVQIFSILGFAYLARTGNDLTTMFWVVSFEYIGVGLGTVALLAFMAKISNKQFTATQFALLSTLATLPRVLASASSGFLVEGLDEDSASWLHAAFKLFHIPIDGFGWENYFYFSFFAAIPGMLMLIWVAPWNGNFEDESSKQEKGAE
ncbi:MAG: AmpG family muropeptide MFS transporter [Kangiellaceae bacterium]|nr:AmpG family muropeptide MFS transporter [Kangiellaceae bacterium]